AGDFRGKVQLPAYAARSRLPLDTSAASSVRPVTPVRVAIWSKPKVPPVPSQSTLSTVSLPTVVISIHVFDGARRGAAPPSVKRTSRLAHARAQAPLARGVAGCPR